MKNYIFIVIVILLILGCNTQNSEKICGNIDTNIIEKSTINSKIDSSNNSLCDTEFTNFIENKINELNLAFEKSDSNEKELFFTEWNYKSLELLKNNYSKPNFKSFFNCNFGEIAKTFYKIIFNPDTIPLITYKSKFNYRDNNELKTLYFKTNGNFQNANYFIVQDKINICICSDSIFDKEANSIIYNKKKIILDTVIYFYTDLQYENKKILFLTDEYEKILNKFFYCPNNEIIKHGLTLLSKRDFLEPEIEISATHWGLSWWYETFPKMLIIVLNQSENKAIVNLRYTWKSGGHAEFKKNNKIWELTHLDLSTWVE